MTQVNDLIGAQGKFAIFIASMLQRTGVAPMHEFAELLSIFAETVADTDPEQATILKAWAKMVDGTLAG